jgi:hypothetical protein
MFKLPSDERLARWRDFRKSLNALPFESALQSLVDFWSRCPFSPYYLDPAHPENWPDPWTLIEENYYCDLAKALGMLYTIKFTDHSPEVEIRVYYDPETKYNYNLVWISNGKYVLNLIEGEIVNKTHVEKNLKLKIEYGKELKLNSY